MRKNIEKIKNISHWLTTSFTDGKIKQKSALDFALDEC